MRITPEVDVAAISLGGRFGPATFTPAWFTLTGLLPKTTASSAVLSIAHEQVTEFSTDWLSFHVDPKHLVAMTATRESRDQLLELVAGMFRDHLPHTLLTDVTIERMVHFRFEKLADRDRLATTLAPTRPWAEWGAKLGPTGKHGGMTSLTMTQHNPADRYGGGKISVTVEPSNRIGQKDGTGVYVKVRNQYVLDGDQACRRLMELLTREFVDALNYSDNIIDLVMAIGTTENAK